MAVVIDTYKGPFFSTPHSADRIQVDSLVRDALYHGASRRQFVDALVVGSMNRKQGATGLLSKTLCVQQTVYG
ncbi:MAG: hypothetical protein HY671_11415 [Chloroflexi bacterium]|nr:hypothetical protein [Chloroflexota bacterium]